MKKQTTGVYLIKDNKILFLVRKKENDSIHKQGIYLPIGGHVELGESTESCAIREVKEESGIDVHSVDLKGIVYVTGHNSGDKDTIMFLFISSDFSGEPVTGNEGSFEWVELAKVQEANIYPGDKIYLHLMQKHQFFVVEFAYKGFDLIEHKILKTL